jgi:glycosyltransferase involved in cell wall biosynthesis
MTRVLLVHGGSIAHYRVAIYNYLAEYLKRHGFELIVTSDRIESDNPHPVKFEFVEMPLGTRRILRLVREKKIAALILFAGVRHGFLFPTCVAAKYLLGRKLIYWGHGCDLFQIGSLKNRVYAVEQAMCDAVLLYAEHLKQYLPRRFYPKTFIANSTLCLDYPGLPPEKRADVLAQYDIRTKKNIICVGRLQRRKRLDHLVDAHARMRRPDIGLILVGPDTDGILKELHGENVRQLGPLFGAPLFDLLSASDVYCLPGAVGLSIVDAFHCGLPFITEAGGESPEIMYLKNGENGFVVPRDDVNELRAKLLLLLDDDALRRRFSAAAKREIAENGSIDKMCAGFRDSLRFALGLS